MAECVSVGEMASVIMESLEEYADLATEDLKEAVRSAGNAMKKDIRENALKRTGLTGKAGRSRFPKEPLILWRLRCIPGTGTGWRTCWNLAMPKGAAAGWLGRRISPRWRKQAFRSRKRR